MTPKQRELYDFLVRWIGAKGYSPSYLEMMAGIKHRRSGINRLLNGLRSEGYITWSPRRKRSLRIMKPNAVQLRPEVLELTDEYARSHGISRETAANELLRGALGAA